MAATLHCHEEFPLACEDHGILNVGYAARLHNQRRILVYRFVKDAASFVVSLASREQKIATQAVAQFLKRCFFQDDIAPVTGDCINIGRNFGQCLKYGSECLASR